MPDPKFERQIQNKMDDLHFTPSAGVWAKVEAGLDQDKKRRRPVFWFFLFGGLAIAMGGWYFVDTMRARNKASLANSTVVTDSKTERAKTGRPKINSALPGLRVDSFSVSASKSDMADTGNGKTESYKENASNKKTNRVEAEHGNGYRKRARLRDMPAGEEVASGIPVTASHSSSGTLTANIDPDESAEKSETTAPAIGSSPSYNKAQVTAKQSDTAAHALDLHKKTTANPIDSLTTKPAMKKPVLVKNHGWLLGINANGGVAAEQRSPFHAAEVPNMISSSQLVNAPLAGYAGNPQQISLIRPGFSFGGGLSARRILSRKWDAGVSLDYHYYASSVSVGNVVANPATLVFFSTTTYSAAYLPTKNSIYQNQYHMIELPVSVGYKIGGGRRNPVRIEGGLNISRFIAGTSVEKTSNYPVYYFRDNHSINKTQLAVTLGFSAGFVRGKHVFELEPNIQYGLTGLMKNTTNPSQHLFYGGLTIRAFRKMK